jgi:predicted nucleotidyltransferase
VTKLTLRVSLDPITVDITRHLQVACDRLRVEWLIVGATARVILLEHVLGFPPARATRDVDFAVAIESWEGFDELKRQLEATGHFTASKNEKQRLHFFPAGTAT